MFLYPQLPYIDIDHPLDRSGMGVLTDETTTGDNEQSLVFKVVKINKYGLRQQRLLVLSLLDGTFRMLNSEMQAKKTMRIDTVAQLGMCGLCV